MYAKREPFHAKSTLVTNGQDEDTGERKNGGKICIFSVVVIYYAIDKSTDTWDLIIFISIS